MVSTTVPAPADSETCCGSPSFTWQEDESVTRRRRRRARHRQYFISTVLACIAVSALFIFQSGAAISLGTSLLLRTSVIGR